jgi:hypothetical protein
MRLYCAGERAVGGYLGCDIEIYCVRRGDGILVMCLFCAGERELGGYWGYDSEIIIGELLTVCIIRCLKGRTVPQTNIDIIFRLILFVSKPQAVQ